ncbi:trichohyalin [Gracilaria domingensis]|nr:trichohyalin [Gracilaria domingensis]
MHMGRSPKMTLSKPSKSRGASAPAQFSGPIQNLQGQSSGQRKSGKSTYTELANVFENEKGYSEKIKSLSTNLKETETVNSILMNHIAKPGFRSGVYNVENTEPRVLFDAGQVAQSVTHGEKLRKRKQKETEAVRMQQKKANATLRRAKEMIEARSKAEKAAAERIRKRTEEHKRREKERQRKRMQLVKRKRDLQSASEQRKRVTEARKFLVLLGKKTALVAHEQLARSKSSSGKRAKVGVKTYQFVALVVVELVDKRLRQDSVSQFIPHNAITFG